jgi:cyanophycinase-like exopeptidase
MNALVRALAAATVTAALAWPVAAGAAPRCAVTVYPLAGRVAPATPRGPGLVLSGAGLLGMPYVDVLRWIRAQVAPRAGRAGNLLILQASGDNYYAQPFYAASTLGSVREILVPPCATRAQVDRLAPYADAADAVLFAGGDQSNYVPWKGSALLAAVRRVYARGGFVGGGSAGLAIQGAAAYDSVAADRVLPDDEDLGSPLATRNPYGTAVSLTVDFFAWPPLDATITDSHFAIRNRFGRLTAFMARMVHSGLVRGGRVYGLGIDEGSVLLVDRSGVATLRRMSGDKYKTQGAYLLSGGAATRLAPLLYTVDVLRISRPGERLDLRTHDGTGSRYRVTVDGARAGLYDRNPYR